MRKSLIGKLTAIALAGVFAFSAAACNNTPATTAAPATDAPATEAPATEGETPATEAPSDETTAAPEETTEAPTGEVMADVPADRYDATVDARTGNNATTPLVLATGTLDGKFSSFFATSAYDTDAVGMTSLGLLYYDKNGEPQAGVEYPSAAYSFSNEVNADNTETLYTFVLKNGLTFSDGEALTMEDVLFSIYVLSDPYYDGSSTYYTMNIEGMNEYRLQTSAEMIEVADAILAAGISGTAESGIEYGTAEGKAAELQEAYWSYLPEAGLMFTQEIIDTVNTSYASDDYVTGYFNPDMTYEGNIKGNETMMTAYGMALWGYGQFGEDGKFQTPSGASYDLTTDTLTTQNYWDEIVANYGYNLSADDGINYEKAGSNNVEDYVNQLFFQNEGAVEGGVTSISGITTTTVTGDDGVEREALEVKINGVDPTAIFKLGITVNPEHYYNEGFSGTLNENGVVVSSQEYFDHLKTKNTKPVGAGPYIFESYENNVITYTANDSFLLGSPKIQTLRYQEVTGGSEMDVLIADQAHFSNPSATQDLINTISQGEGDYAKLNYTLVDNDGYGYIGIQGQAIPELKVRQAIAHAINPQLSVDDYYGELASVNNRTMTKVLWAYPADAEPLYPYDATGETSKALFLEAGYVYDEASNVMSYPEGHEKAGQQVTYKMTLPSASEDHPAGVVFLDTQKVLASIGVVTEIEVDSDLLNKLSTAYDSGIQIWAAAWGGGGVDPDMFQIWYSDPAENQGTSAARSGLYWQFENGDEETKAMLTELNELIKAGRTTLDTEERKPIYARALELSTGLAVEVPTYQRKNMFAYNKEVINADTLFSGEDVTPFQSPISFIWNVELVG